MVLVPHMSTFFSFIHLHGSMCIIGELFMLLQLLKITIFCSTRATKSEVPLITHGDGGGFIKH